MKLNKSNLLQQPLYLIQIPLPVQYFRNLPQVPFGNFRAQFREQLLYNVRNARNGFKIRNQNAFVLLLSQLNNTQVALHWNNTLLRENGAVEQPAVLTVVYKVNVLEALPLAVVALHSHNVSELFFQNDSPLHNLHELLSNRKAVLHYRHEPPAGRAREDPIF